MLILVISFQLLHYIQAPRNRAREVAWILPHWLECFLGVSLVNGLLRRIVWQPVCMREAAIVLAEEDRLARLDVAYRAGRGLSCLFPLGRQQLAPRQSSLSIQLSSGWPIAMDTYGVGHPSPICPFCHESSW